MSEMINNYTNVFEIDPSQVTGFDLKATLAMQATGLYVTNDNRFEEVNERLQQVAEQVKRPPTMTYGDVIFENPYRSMRVLSTDSNIAADEATFYRLHRDIEAILDDTIQDLLFTYNDPELHKTTGLIARDPVNSMQNILDMMRSMRQSISIDSFNSFRQFFKGINGFPDPFPGASGLYSETVPILDLLVHGGSNISAEEREQMLSNIQRGLYPQQRDYRQLLHRFLISDNPQLDMPDDIRHELTKQLNTFRGIHKGHVKKFVPEALSGVAAGSGGVADVAGYLASKIVNIGEATT